VVVAELFADEELDALVVVFEDGGGEAVGVVVDLVSEMKELNV
jgi:hypothetical protein